MAAVPLALLTQLADLGRWVVVLPLLDELLAEDQTSLPALQLMARCLRKVGRLDEAVSAYQLCVLLDPEPYENLVRLADLLLENGVPDDAIASCDAAISVAPDRCQAYAAKSLSLCSLERFKEALENAQVCLNLDPEYAEGWYAKALAEVYLGAYRIAESSYTEAIRLRKEWSLPMTERALLRFQMGDFLRGVEDYEHRWLGDKAPARRHTGFKTWDGEPFEGALLLWAEQGLGDEIFFLGILPHVLERHQDVVVEVDARLVPLVTRSFPDLLVIEKDSSQLSAINVRRELPFASLLLILAKWKVALPMKLSPYLVVPNSSLKVLNGHQSFIEASAFRIGVYWKSFRVKLGASKSLDPLMLAPLTRIANIDLLSLQHGDCGDDVKAFHRDTGVPMKKPEFDVYQEIDLLAALIASCTCIVTIPGVPAHLAAALGVPTFVISRSSRGLLWYWTMNNEGLSWYESARVYLASSKQAISEILTDIVYEVQKNSSS